MEQHSLGTLHFDGSSWSAVSMAGQTDRVWGRAANDVWFFGDDAAIHYDGRGYTLYNPFQSLPLTTAWGLSPTDTWFTTHTNILVRFDGTAWSALTLGSKQ